MALIYVVGQTVEASISGTRTASAKKHPTLERYLSRHSRPQRWLLTCSQVSPTPSNTLSYRSHCQLLSTKGGRVGKRQSWLRDFI